MSTNFAFSSDVSFFCFAFYVTYPHKRHRITHKSLFNNLILRKSTTPRYLVYTDPNRSVYGERLTLVTRWSSDIIPAIKYNSGLPLTRHMPWALKFARAIIISIIHSWKHHATWPRCRRCQMIAKILKKQFIVYNVKYNTRYIIEYITKKSN